MSELLHLARGAISFQARSLQPGRVLIRIADTWYDGDLVAEVVLYLGERGLGLLALFTMIFRQTAFLSLLPPDPRGASRSPGL